MSHLGLETSQNVVVRIEKKRIAHHICSLRRVPQTEIRGANFGNPCSPLQLSSHPRQKLLLRPLLGYEGETWDIGELREGEKEKGAQDESHWDKNQNSFSGPHVPLLLFSSYL